MSHLFLPNHEPLRCIKKLVPEATRRRADWPLQRWC